MRSLMKAVLQRVHSAKVKVNNEIVGRCQKGWFVLLGVTHDDTMDDTERLCQKIIKLRAFNDEQGKMNLDVQAIKGSLLVISQFTLYGDTRKGNRPSFLDAAKPEQAKALYEAFISKIRESQLPVESGVFGAHMDIETHCDGPVTIILDSRV